MKIHRTITGPLRDLIMVYSPYNHAIATTGVPLSNAMKTMKGVLKTVYGEDKVGDDEIYTVVVMSHLGMFKDFEDESEGA